MAKKPKDPGYAKKLRDFSTFYYQEGRIIKWDDAKKLWLQETASTADKKILTQLDYFLRDCPLSRINERKFKSIGRALNKKIKKSEVDEVVLLGKMVLHNALTRFGSWTVVGDEHQDSHNDRHTDSFTDNFNDHTDHQDHNDSGHTDTFSDGFNDVHEDGHMDHTDRHRDTHNDDPHDDNVHNDDHADTHFDDDWTPPGHVDNHSDSFHDSFGNIHGDHQDHGHFDQHLNNHWDHNDSFEDEYLQGRPSDSLINLLKSIELSLRRFETLFLRQEKMFDQKLDELVRRKEALIERNLNVPSTLLTDEEVQRQFESIVVTLEKAFERELMGIIRTKGQLIKKNKSEFYGLLVNRIENVLKSKSNDDT